ncbi:MAG: Vitamin K-dependent gamma-carboxylase [Planctomycetota bacterium]|nr:Vitamin K-dependent gamma-carboxylase [Planctomycetota bacterium]
MTNPLRVWNRFWFAPTSARPLGAFRILFGLIVLANLGLMAPEMDTWLTDAGYLRGPEAREIAGPFWSNDTNRPMRWSPLQTYQDPATVHRVFAATAVVALVFTLGWHTRVMSVLLYGLMLSIYHRNILTLSGADALLMIVCFTMMLCPCGAAYSLDARRKARKIGVPYEPLIIPWAQRLIAIQVTVVYFMTALLKAQGKSWADGTALYWILHNEEARRFTLGLTAYPAVLNALTFGTVVVEFALAFLLWVRAARPWMIAVGVLLHLGIMLTVNIPIFGELMLSCYLAYLTPSEFQAIARVLDPRRWLRSSPTTAPPVRPGRVDPGHEPIPRPKISALDEIPANSATQSVPTEDIARSI